MIELVLYPLFTEVDIYNLILLHLIFFLNYLKMMENWDYNDHNEIYVIKTESLKK